MKRSLAEIAIGDHNHARKRYRLTLEDDPSGPDKREIQGRMLPFLQSVIDQPLLLNCGMAFPERFVVFHNGTSLVLQAEAEVDLPGFGG